FASALAQNLGAEFAKALSRAGGGSHRRQLTSGHRKLGVQIGLVGDKNGWPSRDQLDQLKVNRFKGLRSIQHDQHDVGVSQGFQGSPNANTFGFVQGFANACGIDQPDRNAADGNGFAHQVAGSAGSGGNDGALAFDQAIEEAGFAHVRPADDRESQSFMHELAEGEAAGQLLERQAQAGDAFEDGGIRQDGNVILGEIDAGFESRDQFHQLVLDGLKAAGQSSFELLGGYPRLVQGLGVDKVAHGLGLGEIDAAIEEGAHGELTGLRQSSTACLGEFDNVAQDDG